MVSNIFYFPPYLGKWSNLTNIFQMGWNHQLEEEVFIRFAVVSSEQTSVDCNSMHHWRFLDGFPTCVQVQAIKNWIFLTLPLQFKNGEYHWTSMNYIIPYHPCMVYLTTFTIKINQMHMDGMGMGILWNINVTATVRISLNEFIQVIFKKSRRLITTMQWDSNKNCEWSWWTNSL